MNPETRELLQSELKRAIKELDYTKENVKDAKARLAGAEDYREKLVHKIKALEEDLKNGKA